MKVFLSAALSAVVALSTVAQQTGDRKIIRIATDDTDLVLEVGPNNRLYQTYLGPKLLHGEDLQNLIWHRHAASDGSVSTRGWEVYYTNYALTSEYRELSQQAAQRQRDLEWTISMSKAQREESPENESKQSWFEQMMACVGGLDESSLNSKNRIALATKAYKLVKDVNNYPDVTVQDRTVLRQIFRTLKDKLGPQDPILKELLQQCENGLN